MTLSIFVFNCYNRKVWVSVFTSEKTYIFLADEAMMNVRMFSLLRIAFKDNHDIRFSKVRHN